MSNSDTESVHASVDSPQKEDKQNNAKDNHSIGEYHGFIAQDFHNLARTLTNNDSASTTSLKRYLTHMSQVPGVNPILEEEQDERLNPDSDNFDA